jgi:hypothetical protein
MGQSDDLPVGMFPAVGTPAEPEMRPERSRLRRLVPVFVVVGLALLAVLATVLLLQPAPPPVPSASAPDLSLSSGTSRGAGAAAGATGAGAAGSRTGPTGGGSATTTGSGTLAALRISNFQTTNNVTSWDVVITIFNPADVAQAWTNASVQVPGGLSLILKPVTPGTRVYDAGQTVCVAPTGSAAVPAGSSMDIEFQIDSVLSGAPRSPQLDNPACAQ